MNHDNGSFQSIIDNLYDGSYFVNQDRTITYWNKAAEVLGRSCFDNILTHAYADGK